MSKTYTIFPSKNTLTTSFYIATLVPLYSNSYPKVFATPGNDRQALDLISAGAVKGLERW
jgi:hypothetical protein